MSMTSGCRCIKDSEKGPGLHSCISFLERKGAGPAFLHFVSGIELLIQAKCKNAGPAPFSGPAPFFLAYLPCNKTLLLLLFFF